LLLCSYSMLMSQLTRRTGNRQSRLRPEPEFFGSVVASKSFFVRLLAADRMRPGAWRESYASGFWKVLQWYRGTVGSPTFFVSSSGGLSRQIFCVSYEEAGWDNSVGFRHVQGGPLRGVENSCSMDAIANSMKNIVAIVVMG
jgi:hypothetical protein